MQETLTPEERERAKMLMQEIDDMLNSVRTEIYTAENVYIPYLKEKMRGINNDIMCLNNLLESDVR